MRAKLKRQKFPVGRIVLCARLAVVLMPEEFGNAGKWTPITWQLGARAAKLLRIIVKCFANIIIV